MRAPVVVAHSAVAADFVAAAWAKVVDAVGSLVEAVGVVAGTAEVRVAVELRASASARARPT